MAKFTQNRRQQVALDSQQVDSPSKNSTSSSITDDSSKYCYITTSREYQASEHCNIEYGDCRVFKVGYLGYDDRDEIPSKFLKKTGNLKSLNGEMGHWIELKEIRNKPIKQISTGGYHTLFLFETGEIFAIGWNKYGQLGTGDVKLSEELRKVVIPDLPKGSKIVKVKAAGRHSLFLSSCGRVYSCGCNEDGRLGLNNIVDINKPEQIKSLEGKRVIDIDCGFWYSLFATQDNRIYGFYCC